MCIKEKFKISNSKALAYKTDATQLFNVIKDTEKRGVIILKPVIKPPYKTIAT